MIPNRYRSTRAREGTRRRAAPILTMEVCTEGRIVMHEYRMSAYA